MKKTLSHQFIAILLLPILIILAFSSYTMFQMLDEQTENLKGYCSSTIENVKINIISMTTSMKKTSTIFASQEETQSYLLSASTDTHQLQRQSFSTLIGMAHSYTPGLVDIIVWDKNFPTSMVSYIPADMEDFTVEHFMDEQRNTESYFEFYIQPVTNTPYMIYFSPIYMTTFSKDFGKHLGNIAIICKTDTLNQLVNSTTDMSLNITDDTTGNILYSNSPESSFSKATTQELFHEIENIPNTNLSVTGTIYNEQLHLFKDEQSELLIALAFLLFFCILYLSIAVHHIIIKPIHQLNEAIESTDYMQHELQLHTKLNNEIGSIASHINALLTRIASLNQKNITSQARLYEMEISKKQTQIYAYQSQINPHFLYNMLQCMRGISLMHGIPEVAQICTNMADLFRYSIKGAFLVPLDDELTIIDKYLYMIQVRFQDRISYSLDIHDDTKQCLIPKMILQPLVENAIFHGLDSIENNGMIQISAYRKGSELYILLQDNGIGFDENILIELNKILTQDAPADINASFNGSEGIGIINIHNKIRLYEGIEYGISVESSPGDTRLCIHLNANQTLTEQTDGAGA